MRFRMVLLDSLFGLRKEFTMVALPSPVDQQPLHRFSIHGYLKLTKTLGSCWNQLPIFIRHKLQRFMLFKMPDWISDNCMALGAPNKGMNSVQKQIRTLKFFQWLNLILFSKEHEICHLIYLLFNRSGEESEKKLKKKKFLLLFFSNGSVMKWNLSSSTAEFLCSVSWGQCFVFKCFLNEAESAYFSEQKQQSKRLSYWKERKYDLISFDLIHLISFGIQNWKWENSVTIFRVKIFVAWFPSKIGWPRVISASA